MTIRVTVKMWETGEIKIPPDVEFKASYAFVPLLGFRLVGYMDKDKRYSLDSGFVDILEEEKSK